MWSSGNVLGWEGKLKMAVGLKIRLDLIRAKKRDYCHNTERRKIIKRETVLDRSRIKWLDWTCWSKMQFQLQKTRKAQGKVDIAEGKWEGRKFGEFASILKYSKHPTYSFVIQYKKICFNFKTKSLILRS